MKVIKRNDQTQEFCIDKIINALRKANDSVAIADQMDEASIQKVVNTVNKYLEGFNSISVDDIQNLVEKALVRHNKYVVSKAYMLYRENKRQNKKYTLTEEKALSLINGTSDLRGDNANKHIDDNGAISDYLAGILTKSIVNKMLPKDIVKAHNSGLIHWHDSDYSPLRPLHNCDLINVEDMFANGFQMQNTMIKPNSETPFRTICNLLAQINLIVSGRQYGGQTISWSHVLPYIDSTRQLIRKKVIYDFQEVNVELTEDELNEITERKLREEIYEGVKTYQYQILCHSSSNGQTPFVSNNLCLREAVTERELKDFAILIEEIFKRRIKGIKDATGHYVTPLFPKLLYWLCEGLNANENDPYWYLTELAAQCEIARTQPDINSEKECRRVKNGQIIPSMGCRSLLSPIWEEVEYPVDTQFYWTTGKVFPYGTFVQKKSFAEVNNGSYQTGYENGEYCINFRGNTGWLIQKTDEKVVILMPKVYGRWNNGVVTVNLPHVALEARELSSNPTERIDKFFQILDERLELCHKALKIRYDYASKIKAKNSEILWMYGALARMDSNETVGDLMKKYPQRASISLGYVGLFETCQALLNESNTTTKGRVLSKEILQHMNDKCNEWKLNDLNESGLTINYSIYGTPEESLTYKFAMANRKDFGLIEKITDKDYVVNSYHVDPREDIDAFTKLEIEGEYLALSAGGAVSYVETLDLTDNPKVITDIMKWMYEHILYAEFNRKIGLCYKCGYTGDIELVKTHDGEFKFICPECGNSDDDYLDVTARLCGYLGKVNAGNTNKGRLDDIYNRVIHLDNLEDNVKNEF